MRYLDYLKFKFYFILHAHILNPLWNTRSRRRLKYSSARNRAVYKYLYRYLDIIKGLTPPLPSDTRVESERAFSIWFQGESSAPNSVKACFETMRLHNKEELIVLDEPTLAEWISLPDYIIKKWKDGKIGHAHFSDICRVELLFQHGGLWFDATDYVTSTVPEDIMEADFFVFMGGHKLRSGHGFIQNCFIRAKKGNPLIGLWRQAIHEYWKHEDKAIDYFFHQILFQVLVENNELAAQLFENMIKIDQDPTHVLWWGHRNDSYDSAMFNKWTSGTFFQKTNYKDKDAKNPLPGTIAAHMFHSENR